MFAKMTGAGHVRMGVVLALTSAALTLGMTGCGASDSGNSSAPQTSPQLSTEYAQLPDGGKVLCVKDSSYGSISCDWNDYAGQNRRQ